MGRKLLVTYGVLGFAFLYLPIFFLVLFSFNDYIIPSLPFRGFTLRWYRELGFDFVLHEALFNSLFIAACTTVVSTTLGTNDGIVTIYWGAWRTDLSLNLFVLIVVGEIVWGVGVGWDCGATPPTWVCRRS